MSCSPFLVQSVLIIYTIVNSVAGSNANQQIKPPPSVAVPQGLREILTLEDGTRIQVEGFPGPSKFAILHHLFTSTSIHVHCEGLKDFAVYSGQTVDEVRHAYSDKIRSWCGWERFMGHAPEDCIVPVPALEPAVVAVVKPKTWLLSSSSQQQPWCSMHRSERLSVPRLLTAVVGALFFFAAPQLSESTPFRLASGSLGFTFLSSGLVLLLLYRSLPHRKSFIVSSALFGSTLAAIFRYIFGTWLPTFSQILQHPLVVAYTVLSALMGMALTYYYNDSSNRKINTMLRVALRGIGLIMVASSTSSREGSVAIVLATLGWKAYPFIKQEGWSVFRIWKRAVGAVEHEINETMPASQVMIQRQEQSPITVATGAPGTTTPHHHGTLARVMDMAAHAAQVPSPLVDRGLILNVETGKTIQIGKQTYNTLRDKGYDVDFVAGTITPPSTSRLGGGPSRSSRRSSNGSARGSRSRSRSRPRNNNGT